MEILDKMLKKKNVEEIVDVGIETKKPEATYQILDDYYIKEPYSKINIVKSPELGEGLYYYSIEDPLSPTENDTYQKLMKILSKELEPPTEESVSPTQYVLEQAQVLVKKYERSLGKYDETTWSKIYYYVVRDLAGYGPLDAIMHDPEIEDISCNGVDSPLYVWHRKWESIPTNLTFVDGQILNDFIVKLAHKRTKHISRQQH